MARRGAGGKWTAALTRTILVIALPEIHTQPIRLNLIDDGHNRYHTATQPGEGVREILRALSRLDLVESVAITKEIVPR